MRRHKLSRRSSKRSFRHGAAQVNSMNMSSGSTFTMRGGIRL